MGAAYGSRMSRRDAGVELHLAAKLLEQVQDALAFVLVQQMPGTGLGGYKQAGIGLRVTPEMLYEFP